jgi:D-alanyl-D-alanine carboxypeptidase
VRRKEPIEYTVRMNRIPLLITVALTALMLGGCSSAERSAASDSRSATSGAITVPSPIEATAPPGTAPAKAAVPDAKTFTQADLESLLSAQLAGDPASPGWVATVVSPSRGIDVSGAVGVIDRKSGRPLLENSTFRLGSLTKPFTAAAVLRLVEMQKLRLDQTLSESGINLAFLESLRQDGYQVDVITIEQLLNHSSGLPDVPSSEEYVNTVVANPTKIWTPLEQVQFAVDRLNPISKPGEGFHYSDTGYVLLGQIIEAATGRPFGIALREILDFEGLGLTSTYWESKEPIPSGGGERASQYMGDLDIAQLSPTVDLFGGGGLVSSNTDLVRFLRALTNGNVFASPQTLTDMTDRQSPGSDGYGLGISSIMIDDVKCFWHGSTWGVYAFTCPEIDLSFSFSNNQVDTKFDPPSFLKALKDAALQQS